ncbi:MAG: helix-turn-helix transcriptional regulator [Deltaproteobacteria bacterium]|nr:helix-turn-helix transcriptional regulator [Deltaproteobacteria bacterium]
MVREEWSLVDWVDHDGKRFLLAQENRVPVAGRRALTDRERQVVACAAMGHTNKLIAYDLGLSTGTVSVLLLRAAEKLGVSGRVALIRAFRELA